MGTSPYPAINGKTSWLGRVLGGLAVLATAAVVLVQVFLFRGPPHLSLSAEKVNREYVVSSVTPGGIGWDAGIRRGQRLLDVVGGTLKQGTSGLLAVNPTEVALAGPAASRVSAQSYASVFIEEETEQVFWALGLLFAISAAVILLVRAWDRASWALFLFLVCAGLVLALAPASGTQGGRVFQGTSLLGILAAAIAWLWFFLIFPNRSVSMPKRDRLALFVTALTGSVIYAFLLWGLFSASEVYNYARAAIGSVTALVALAGLAELLLGYRETIATIRRVQFALVLGTLGIGLAPAVFLVAVPLTLGFSSEKLPILLSLTAMSIVPLGLVHAVTRYQRPYSLLGTRALMPAMIAFSSFVIGCLIALVLSKYFSAHIDVDRTGVVILGSIAAATALLVLGMRRRLRRSHENGPGASQALGRVIVELAALGEPPGSLIKAVEGMRKAIEDLSNVAVVFKVHGADFVKALSPEKRMDLYHIILEALAGAVRQSRATEVFAVLDAGPEEVTFWVKDNGTGFILDDVEGTSGAHPELGQLRSRVHSSGGTCMIWSKPEAGTIVKVSVPSV